MTMDKPSSKEDEYFAREDALNKERIALEQLRNLEDKAKEELKKLHWMHCPKCGMDLHTITFHNVEIDRCFGCGGHFLDAGELEKLATPEHGQVMSSVLNWFKTNK
jgi:hypothetical protein